MEDLVELSDVEMVPIEDDRKAAETDEMNVKRFNLDSVQGPEVKKEYKRS